MRVLVTGASGTLGAYVLPALVEAGHDPIAWGGRDAGPRAGISLRPIDLADPSVTDEALEADDPDAILHLAAVSTPAAVLGDPDRAHLVNVEATGRLAGWCERSGRRLVYTSTTSSSTAGPPGAARTTRPTRCPSTGGPSETGNSPSWRPLRGWWRGCP
jgi:nucleoside-diphosphate-sugar epimerase